MTRIAPQPVTQKQPVFRDRKWLDSAKDRECDVCGSVGTTVFAHMRDGMGGGMGLKPPDYLGAFLCFEHHAHQEQNPGPRWWVDMILVPWMRTRHAGWRNDP